MIIVDRIEGIIAICIQDTKQIDIPLSKINGNVSEGDILAYNDSSMLFEIKSDETTSRRESISKRFDRLKKRNT